MPTLTDTELLQYVIAEPHDCVTLADRYIVVVGRGDRYAVFDAATETSKAYEGLVAIGGARVKRRVTSYGGYAWTTTGMGDVARIGSDGSLTTFTNINVSAYSGSYSNWLTQSIDVCGNWLIGKYFSYTTGALKAYRWGFKPSDASKWTAFEGTTTTGCGLTDGTHQIIADSSTRYSPSTGASVGSGFPTPPGGASNFGWDGCFTLDGDTYLAINNVGTLREFSLSTGSSVDTSLGMIAPPILAPNNMLYFQTAGSLRVMERSTKAMATWTFTHSRSYRGALGFAGGKAYSFAGETPV